MVRPVIRQTIHILKQKEAVAVETVLLLFVSIGFIGNVAAFRGYDVSQMYQPVKLLAISYNRVNRQADLTTMLVMLYPVIVTLPAGLTYINEHMTKEAVYLTARLGKRKYLASRMAASFLAAFLVFLLPLLADLLLHCVSFPMQAGRDLSHCKIYSEEYAGMVRNYLYGSVYRKSPVWYAVLGSVMFGVVSGLFNMFAVALSFVFRVRYRVLLLLPNFLLLNLSVYIGEMLRKRGLTVSWYEYMLLFSDSPKSGLYWGIVLLSLMCLSVVCFSIAEKKESLL